jgi:CubicO group peptidase (beta-lactamase class C family)
VGDAHRGVGGVDVLPAGAGGAIGIGLFSERQELPKGSDWALGWDTPTEGQSSSGKHFSTRSIGHLGFTGTSLWIDLEREAAVVMLTNRVHLVAKRSKFQLRAVVHDLVMESFVAE